MKISTERLTIRRIVSGDWEAVKKIWDDQNSSEFARFDKPKDTDPDAVRLRIEKWASFENSAEHMFFAVCLDGKVIGYVAFNVRESGYEIGYAFLADFQGKGYAKESIAALIGAIKKEVPTAKITAGTALENVPSVKLLQALGFRQAGTERVSFYTDAAGQPIYFDGGVFVLE